MPTKSFRKLVRDNAKRDEKFAKALVREAKGRVGSSFDQFLKEEGIYRAVAAHARKRAIARARGNNE